MATATTLEAFQTIEDLLDALGGIAPGRVRLHPTPGTATEADLIAFNARKVGICELVDGVLVEKGMGYEESNLAALLIGLLNAFVIPRNLGLVSGADGMMRLFPGLVREPDVAFASWDRIPGRRRPKTPIAGFAPDLAIEVLTRSNRKAEMARKRREYFAAGVRLVLKQASCDLQFSASALTDQGRTASGPGHLNPVTLASALLIHPRSPLFGSATIGMDRSIQTPASR